MPLTLVLRFALLLAVLATLLFTVAGRTDLPFFWAYLFIFGAVGMIGSLVVHRRDPTLFRERMKPGPGGKDPGMRRLAAVCLLAALLMAGLDAGRFRWSRVIPAVQLTALILVAVALAIWMWAMSTNRFFSSDARIQRDRGHHVISDGPYRFVRHPGYAVAIILFLATPVALGSWWGLIPVAPLLALFLRRTSLEDRLLLAELEGYADYAARVRYRLIPGLW